MAEKTALQIAQEFCNRVGLPVPLSLQSQDDTARQVLSLMNEGIQDICDRYKLQQLSTFGQFVHAGGPDYGAVNFTALASPAALSDWKYNEPFTLWAGSQRLPVTGPLTMSEWQRLLRMSVASAPYQYILYGNWLRIYPVPTNLADLFYVFYQSKCGVIGGPIGNVLFETFSLDTDQPRIPTYLLTADLKWRWKKEKGLPYAEDQRMAESMLVNAVGRQPHPVLNLDYGDRPVGPQIVIRPGNW